MHSVTRFKRRCWKVFPTRHVCEAPAVSHWDLPLILISPLLKLSAEKRRRWEGLKRLAVIGSGFQFSAGAGEDGHLGKYFSSTRSPLGWVKTISIRRLCLEWIVYGRERVHDEMQMPAFKAQKRSVLIWTNAGNCVKKQLFGFGCGIRNELEKQAQNSQNERGVALD